MTKTDQVFPRDSSTSTTKLLAQSRDLLNRQSLKCSHNQRNQINKVIPFEDGLHLVAVRSKAMQQACQLSPGTMAAVLGLKDEVVEEICAKITQEVVVPANYNCPRITSRQ